MASGFEIKQLSFSLVHKQNPGVCAWFFTSLMQQLNCWVSCLSAQPSAPRSKRCHRCPTLSIRCARPTVQTAEPQKPLLSPSDTSTMCSMSCCTPQRDAGYSGSRWQPSKPRPPQSLRGVSCIRTLSDGPPEALGRSTLTMIGICDLLACAHRGSASRPRSLES